MLSTPSHVSLTVAEIWLAGSEKPYLPVSRSSYVYEYVAAPEPCV